MSQTMLATGTPVIQSKPQIEGPLRIALISSEAVPFSKTGGLADVSGALASALAEQGHDVCLLIPNYILPNQQRDNLPPIEDINLKVSIDIHSTTMHGRVLESSLPGGVRVLLIDQPHYFERPGIYLRDGQDFPDNCERFSFFSRAALLALKQLDWSPDVVHANDWQTGMVPALLKVAEPAEYFDQPPISIFTLHNLAFQGRFWKWDFPLTGLDWKFYNWRQAESHEQLNLVKTGIVFTDFVTTVSPTYAREIRTPEFGCGLEDVLREHSHRLRGILNGIDDAVWNPAVDSLIPHNYDSSTFTTGKPMCKSELLKEVGLPAKPNVPLIGMVSRMTDQKGFDLIEELGDQLLSGKMQFVFLGTGEARFENMLRELAKKAPELVAATIGFNEKLAHTIEAGCDIFLMPSRYEPCGLNQMYSLAYGTVPVVRRVGGLADSVIDANPENVRKGIANGFQFEKYESAELMKTIDRAVAMFKDRRQWIELVRTGMKRDWSWSRSADEYLQLYGRAIEARQGTLANY